MGGLIFHRRAMPDESEPEMSAHKNGAEFEPSGSCDIARPALLQTDYKLDKLKQPYPGRSSRWLQLWRINGNETPSFSILKKL